MNATIQIRQQNPDESENMAKLDSESDVYGYLSRHLADKLGEYMEVEISQDDGTEVPADGVTGSGSGNFVTFESDGGNIVGFGVHLDILADVLDTEFERDADGNVTNAPESVSMTFRPSTEEDYEDADTADEDEAEALISLGEDSDESSQEDEAEEITDEELDLDAEA